MRMIGLLKNLLNNLGYVILIAFFVSNLSIFRKAIQKHEFNRKELIILSLIFGGFGILGTYSGTEIKGAIANTRLIGVMSGGIMCGPVVGTAAGLIAGLHRLTVGIGRFTAVPCAISTVLGGFFSAVIYNKSNDKNRWAYGLLAGIFMESVEMLLILIISKPFSQAVEVIRDIYFPMGLTNGIGIAILIIIIQRIFNEKEEIAAKQAQLALEIANKTLPYFREINSCSLKKICEIIKDSINADAVSITDNKKILAHVGLGSDHHIAGSKLLTAATKQVIKDGNIRYINHASEINCKNQNCPLKSAVIAPIFEGEEVIGTLKIYYGRENAISFSSKNLALGLSQIISTQLEISKVGKLKELAANAEIRALQAQINPHFLFNALNTIISFMRTDPNKARDLTINLSTFLRYNIESGESLVNISRELEQVNAYVEIEKARFGEKLDVEYNIEENINIKIPSLIIQPLVENSIKHGILEGEGQGTVKVNVTRVNGGKIRISVEDNGSGISEDIIHMVEKGKIDRKKIGIANVNSRLKYLYGKGLEIERLAKGTRVSFTVHDIEG